MWHGVIFDLDGTLLDSLPGIANSLNRALASRGFPGHSLGAVRGFVGGGARELVRRALPGGRAVGAEEEARLEEVFREDYGRTWREGTHAYPGIRLQLGALMEKGVPMAVVSNKPHAFTVEMVAEVLPGIVFRAVLGQREGAPRKPHPAAVREACRAMGCRQDEIVLVGDSTIDLQTARNAGLAAAAVTWGYHDREALALALPDRLLERVEELSGLAGPVR